MIYIDQPIHWKGKDKKKYFHIIATNIKELHEFAQLIGLKTCWFERSAKGWPHYDAPEEYYYSALNKKANLVDMREIPKLLEKFYG